VPSDVELHAEVETQAYARDMDGDLFESGDKAVKRALAQSDWTDGMKRYVVKAVLPPDTPDGTLKVYAGKRGLMHSVKDNPYALAFTLPIFHSGTNPPYNFFLRHPTPHANRNDLYVAQPQCHTLAFGNTFVFAVRQHPASLPNAAGAFSRTAASPAFDRSANGAISPMPFRPMSAMSMISASPSGSGSQSSDASSQQSWGAMGPPRDKPAKLAVQTPGGKILRMSRKVGEVENDSGSGTWESYIKVSERGTWRGLVLADRSARWCVFGEWECV